MGANNSVGEEASRSSFDVSQMWKRVGFTRHAPEFWLLAKIVLERLEADRRQPEGTHSSGNECGNIIDVLSLGSPVLDKYDETSMGQVNDIITMFQRLNV